jgi:hypothetical protein
VVDWAVGAVAVAGEDREGEEGVGDVDVVKRRESERSWLLRRGGKKGFPVVGHCPLNNIDRDGEESTNLEQCLSKACGWIWRSGLIGFIDQETKSTHSRSHHTQPEEYDAT